MHERYVINQELVTLCEKQVALHAYNVDVYSGAGDAV